MYFQQDIIQEKMKSSKPTYTVEDILRELYLNSTPPTIFDSIDKTKDNWWICEGWVEIGFHYSGIEY